jgi:hypothetical protein
MKQAFVVAVASKQEGLGDDFQRVDVLDCERSDSGSTCLSCDYAS